MGTESIVKFSLPYHISRLHKIIQDIFTPNQHSNHVRQTTLRFLIASTKDILFFFNKRHTFKGKVERYAQCRKLSNSAIQEQPICVLNALNVQNEVTEVHVVRVLMGL